MVYVLRKNVWLLYNQNTLPNHVEKKANHSQLDLKNRVALLSL